MPRNPDTPASKKAASAAPLPRRLLTPEQAAAYLSVNRGWIKRAVAERRIPHTHVGRLLRFKLEELDAYIAANSVEAVKTDRRVA